MISKRKLRGVFKRGFEKRSKRTHGCFERYSMGKIEMGVQMRLEVNSKGIRGKIFGRSFWDEPKGEI